MDLTGASVLVLGGWGLVGTAVCRELLSRKPSVIWLHSLRQEEAEAARLQLLPDTGETKLVAVSGDVLGLCDPSKSSRRQRLHAELMPLRDDELDKFLLYTLLTDTKPDVVIDCINTATVIAYRDLYRASHEVYQQLDSDKLAPEAVEDLLDSLYIPRLVRHLQILYRGMSAADVRVYIKVGTTGTGGMGLNIPYTHSEERPSRVLLSKSAVAGAHSMLLFLMARTPDAPITKEIKPATAIAWKRINHGPIYRKGEPIHRIDARPRTLTKTLSTFEPDAAGERDEILQAAYIDTGENGIFSLEEFAALTTVQQMEFVTPEEIAQYLVFEIEGGNTGHDIINALDNAVLGPSYRAGMMRHWALEHMRALEQAHGTYSVAFEMLGPPRLSKLLFEVHLLRQAFGTMAAVREATPATVSAALETLVCNQAELVNDIAAVGIPILLAGDKLLRGQRIIVPSEADDELITAEKIDAWAHEGWVDLRLPNCAQWITRFQQIHQDSERIAPNDTSSRHLRTRKFWAEDEQIQPGKIVGWIFSTEEHGERIKE